MSLGGANSGSSEFDGERCLLSRIYIQRLSDEKAKSSKLKVVEFLVGRKKKRGIAGAKAIREFGERDAIAE